MDLSGLPSLLRDALPLMLKGAGWTLLLAVASVAVLGAVKARRGAAFAALFPPLALALVTAFIVFNKVGSPQYLTWIVVPLVAGLVLTVLLDDTIEKTWPTVTALVSVEATE